MAVKRYRSSALLNFNIKAHLEREFVNAGQYINISSGYFTANNDRADLLSVATPTVYESAYDSWISETDHTGATGYETTLASGVYIDGTFYLRDSAPYGPHMDYRNGRVVFTSGIPAGSTVLAEFSAPNVTVDFPDSDTANLLFSTVKDNVDFATTSVPSGFERQLPAVIIDLQGRTSAPWQLGGGQEEEQKVVFHLLANNRTDLDQLVDLLTEGQYRTVIQGVDFNNTDEQYTQYGDRASTYANFTTMQASGAIQWSKIYIDETKVMERGVLNGYHRARVDWTINFYRPSGG